MVQSLISQNAEIQKILAFEGAFEKLLNIVASEGGIEGGIVVQDSLTSIDGLLRFNVSNQVCFLNHWCIMNDSGRRVNPVLLP